MYNFVDVNEVSGSILPSEALQINGEYIEDLIPGYRTLSVSGRESLSPEIETYETGVRDGAKIKYKRFPARLIVVKYQIIAKTNETFREAYNKLGGVLNVQDAMLIFNDETDKYFIGTPYEIGEVEPGRNAVIGEFNILCADPFKYSVQEYVATAGDGENSVLINYKGTHKAYPVLESVFYTESEDSADGETSVPLTGAGDCGFVSFFTEDEKIIQLGNPDEADVQDGFPASQTLMNQPFNTSGAWGTTSKSLWAENEGYTTADITKAGTPSMKALKFIAASPASTSGELLNKTVSAPPAIPAEYVVTAKTSDRSENAVKVTVTVSVAIGKMTVSQVESLVGKSIQMSIYMGAAWHNIDVPLFKNATYYFSDGSSAYRQSGYVTSTDNAETKYSTYTSSTSFTISGLTGTTKTLTDIMFKATAPGAIASLASTACANLAISAYTTPSPVSYYLTPANYGSGTGWHGLVITRDVPADQAGEVGATNFKLSYAQIFAAKSTKELGAFEMNLTDANGQNISSVLIHKNQTGASGSIVFYVNGVKQYDTYQDLSLYNKFFGASSSSKKSTVIQKSGNKIIFNVGGIQKTFINDDIATRKVAKLTFAFTQWKTNAALSYNGIYNLKFVKDNCADMRDIPNKFSANDILEADCKTGEILLNGVTSPELGALGNDWEQFILRPGLNEIGFAFSEWVTADYAPTITVRYREVFL